jgi:hypothetical protein
MIESWGIISLCVLVIFQAWWSNTLQKRIEALEHKSGEAKQ